MPLLTSLGLILIAVDQAVPDRPEWITAALAFGLIVNPLLFIPLAWGPGPKEKPIYQTVVVGSFLAVSVGLTALAFHALV